MTSAYGALAPSRLTPSDLFALPPPIVLREMLADVPARPTPVECRNCGSPHIVAGEPCRYCQVTTTPKPNRPAWECPKCAAQVERVEVCRDPMAGASVLAVGCHGNVRTATVSAAELDQMIERDAYQRLFAGRIAEAIDRFALEDT